jgi:hypothetical protein
VALAVLVLELVAVVERGRFTVTVVMAETEITTVVAMLLEAVVDLAVMVVPLLAVAQRLMLAVAVQESEITVLEELAGDQLDLLLLIVAVQV